MAIYRLGEMVPRIHESAYVAPGATIIGNVELGPNASVWPGVVIRGDNDLISIGENSNVQDNSVLHTDLGFPMRIAANVTIGHSVMLHGCTIHEGSLIGIQAVILNGAVIGRNCLVGAGAVVTEGKQFPDGVLILGAPARAVRELDEDNIRRVSNSGVHYVEKIGLYRKNLVRID